MDALQAVEVLQRLREDPDAEADVVSYSSAIMACERGGRCEEALQLFDDMQQAALQPTPYIYMVRQLCAPQTCHHVGKIP